MPYSRGSLDGARVGIWVSLSPVDGGERCGFRSFGVLLMLTFTFLGVGGAFTRRHYHSNVLVEAWADDPSRQNRPDDVLLIDFGASGPAALFALSEMAEFSYLRRDLQLDYSAIRGVFVTHTHADHIGGLEDMAFLSRFTYANAPRPELISDKRVIELLWDRSLRGGLEAVPGGLATLSDYFDVRELDHQIPDRRRFAMLDRYRFELFPTDHIRIHTKYDWPSFGFMVRDDQSEASVYFSGDTRFDLETHKLRLERADWVFHDAQLEDVPDPVHALISELRTMPESIRRKTYLYHYSDAWDQPAHQSAGAEFAGFVQQHLRYDILP